MGKHSSHRMSMKYAILGLVVLAAAASAQTYASSSSYTSGYASATTSGAVTITQQVTLSITAAQYTGNTKTLMETAYGIALGIYTTTGTAGFKTGCSVLLCRSPLRNRHLRGHCFRHGVCRCAVCCH